MSYPKTRSSPNLAELYSIEPSPYGSWEYNVADHLKDKTSEEIKQHLKKTALPFAVCCENWEGDFNFSTLVRNSNCFNAREIFYFGNKKWDKRGAQGCHNYSEVKWLPTLDDLIKLKETYTFIGIDNVKGSIPMTPYQYPKMPLFLFGSESVGLTPIVQALCQDILHIEMFGSIRSLNCGCASAIACYDFVNKWKAQ